MKLIFVLLTAAALGTIGCDVRTGKQRCLDGNTKANPTKYTWTPETGTLNSLLAPDDTGTCSVKVGEKG